MSVDEPEADRLLEDVPEDEEAAEVVKLDWNTVEYVRPRGWRR